MDGWTGIVGRAGCATVVGVLLVPLNACVAESPTPDGIVVENTPFPYLSGAMVPVDDRFRRFHLL